MLRGTTHAPFKGFNRARAAAIEAVILVNRLEMLTHEKVEHEKAYLEIAVAKMGSAVEEEAWGWLKQEIAACYAGINAKATRSANS